MIPLFKPYMPVSVMPKLQQTLFSGYIGEGPRTHQFENELCAWLNVPRIAAVNSGTSAIQLALRLAGVGPGDEVVTPPLTCVATNTPILALGARPVWADIDPWTGNVLAEDVARKCTSRTKAVIAVHWGGYPCDLHELAAVAQEHSIAVIEDAAHAFGSEYDGELIGRHSDFVCFSFQAIKMLTTGDGGALACRSEVADSRARKLRWFGLDRAKSFAGECRWDQDIAEYGGKFHMNDIAATIGIEQLRHVRGNIECHRAHAAAYDRLLTSSPHVRPLQQEADRRSNHWLYTLRVRNRAHFINYMNDAGIEVSRVHIRNDHYSMFRDSQRGLLPGVTEFDTEQVNIPCGWWLTPEEVSHVVSTLLMYKGSD